MSVRQAQATIAADEYAEWAAYCRLDPFGNERGDLQAAVVAKTIADVNRGKNQKPYRLSDFLLVFNKPKQNWQAIKQQMKVFVGFQKTQMKKQGKKNG